MQPATLQYQPCYPIIANLMAISPEQASSYHEERRTPEHTFRLTEIGGIIISGNRGTGKTHILSKLQKRYAIEPIDIGTGVRTDFEQTTGEVFGGARTRADGSDLMVDIAQWDLFRTATPESPFLLNSWLGAFFAKKMESKGTLPSPILRILLYTDPPEVANERAAKRDAKKKAISVDQASQENTERFAQDWTQWSQLYPELKGLNLYSPGVLDSDKKPFYDLEVDVSNLDKDTPAEVIHKWLVEEIERRKKQKEA